MRLNAFAEQLFADARFSTSATSVRINVVCIPVGDLGFPAGTTWKELIQRAASRGLGACPLELAPHLRLLFTEAVEEQLDQFASRNKAPSGSLTVVSEPISPDDDIPQGFYLRRIEGASWLRGYRSWAGHVWAPDDLLLFRDLNGVHNASIEATSTPKRACTPDFKP